MWKTWPSKVHKKVFTITKICDIIEVEIKRKDRKDDNI